MNNDQHPLQHGSAQAQHDLLGLKLRDSLVRTRADLINTVRFTLKMGFDFCGSTVLGSRSM